MPINIIDVVLGFVALIALKSYHDRRRSLGPLPPGPKGLPIIGNLLDMPSHYPWITFSEWAGKWGDICSLTIFNQTFIIINSAKIASDLLDKRSAIYSDRPVLPMAGELVGFNKTFTLAPYGSSPHKNGRKLSARVMGSPAALKVYLPVQEMEARKFLRRVLDEPDSLNDHIRMMAGTLIQRIIYGYEVKEKDDPFLSLAEVTVDAFGQSTAPGAWLVDVIPALRFLPWWFPGAGFKKQAAEWSQLLLRFVNEPLDFVKEQMGCGTAQPSFLSTLLAESPSKEHEIKWTAATNSAGGHSLLAYAFTPSPIDYNLGSDTSVGQILAFFLAMILHPEVLRKAQAEVDEVTGGERLPEFQDREKLKYVNAVVMEVFRWHSLVPGGIPHMLRENDEYNGYLLPQGSIVLTNIWWMTHNPAIFPDPLEFRPERFLNCRAEENANPVWFGFGRRICSGMHLANSSVWIACAVSLAVFDITEALDQDGKPIKPKQEYTTGTIAHPKLFAYSIKPRSESAVALMRADIDDQLAANSQDVTMDELALV